ncbi:MAG: methyltransferase domain-containing protein [Corynebacterium sp.]|nr:methyltransferase domain-containing protein [Corynebacterium sp.]
MPKEDAGHWVLASLGKTVLRPGGRATTHWLLDSADIPVKAVVEFAPGLGVTAQEILSRHPLSYVGIDETVQHPYGRVIKGQAQDTGLPSESADVVIGEAMLSMQSERVKKEIMTEAARLLRPGGLYLIHELLLLDASVEEQVRKDLARVIKVNARPSTLEEWTAIAEEAGFERLTYRPAPMGLLDPKQMFVDEGPLGMARIAFNAARKPEARKRMLEMRATFAKHKKDLGAIGIVFRKKA